MTRPDELYLSVEREEVGGTCPQCGADELRRYPALGERRWEIVVKCQVCLHSVERKPGPRLGYVSLPIELLDA